MSEQKLEEFFEHFGVLGMHWGVRNDTKLTKKQLRISKVRKSALSSGLKAGATSLFMITMMTQLQNPDSGFNRGTVAFIKSQSSQNKSGRKFASQILKTNGKLPVSTLSDFAKSAAINVGPQRKFLNA